MDGDKEYFCRNQKPSKGGEKQSDGNEYEI